MFLGDDTDVLTVCGTCHELWLLAAEQQAVAWSFDRLWAKYHSRPMPVRLLSLAFVRCRHALSLSIDWVDHSHLGSAAPVRLS